jgi:hypothetical protein
MEFFAFCEFPGFCIAFFAFCKVCRLCTTFYFFVKLLVFVPHFLRFTNFQTAFRICIFVNKAKNPTQQPFKFYTLQIFLIAQTYQIFYTKTPLIQNFTPKSHYIMLNHPTSSPFSHLNSFYIHLTRWSLSSSTWSHTNLSRIPTRPSNTDGYHLVLEIGDRSRPKSGSAPQPNPSTCRDLKDTGSLIWGLRMDFCWLLVD